MPIMKSEKSLKRNCILISEFKKCGFGVGDMLCQYDKSTYVGLFKFQQQYIIYVRILSSETYVYDNYKDAYTRYIKMIDDVK